MNQAAAEIETAAMVGLLVRHQGREIKDLSNSAR
tara:strand:- start:153 stop:254 length:102 start_codon:yes stop_codon:yes gene_type:complete